MVPLRVSVPEGLLMFIFGREEDVPPPVSVCAPVPIILIEAVPVVPKESSVIFPLASRVPVLMTTCSEHPPEVKASVPLAVRVVPLAMTTVFVEHPASPPRFTL